MLIAMGRQHRPEGRSDPDQQRPRCQRDDPNGNQRTFGSQPVNQSTRRSLGQDSSDPAKGKNESHALFIPPISGQENRKEWPDSRLDIGEKKIQPVQTEQGLPRRGPLALDGGIRLGCGLHTGVHLEFDECISGMGWFRPRGRVLVGRQVRWLAQGLKGAGSRIGLTEARRKILWLWRSYLYSQVVSCDLILDVANTRA